LKGTVAGSVATVVGLVGISGVSLITEIMRGQRIGCAGYNL
jgi:hypothetical protein